MKSSFGKPSYSFLLMALIAGLSTVEVKAALTYWDPLAGSGTTTSDYTGTWENTSWAAGTASLASQTAWVDATAAAFTAGASTASPAFTVTMNSMHTVAGVFNGGLTGVGACKVTINGPGPLFMNGTATTFQGFSIAAGGFTTINTPISGAAIVTLESSGQIFLNATNIYTGGTSFGFSTTTPFTGICNFNSASSFGTGNVTITNTGTTGIAALVYTGTTPITITNKIIWGATNSGLNIVSIPAGITFSGTCAFNANTTNANLFTGGGSTNLVIMSGIMSSGKAGGWFNKGNQSTLRLSAANTYNLNTTVSNGVLQAGINTAIRNGSGKGDLYVAKNVNNVDVGTVDVNGFSITCNGLFGDGVIDNTAAGAGTITFGGNNVTANFAGTFQNTGGPLNITKTGTGTQTINAGTYTGNTTVNGGTLVLNGGGNGVLPAVSPVSIASGAILDVQYQPLTMTNLAGRGNIMNNANTLTVANNFTTNSSLVTYSCFSGGIDNGALVKTGNGAMSLRGTNVLPSGVTVQGGTLSVGAGPDRIASAGGAVLTIGNGATFQLDAATQTVAQLSGTGFINLGGGTLNVNTPLGNTYSGVIRDTDIGPNSTATGHGLRGYYYDNQDFSSLLVIRDDAQVLFTNLTLPDELPAPIYPNTNQYSIRWVGQVLAPVTGNYIFSVAADDGVRLWVGGFPVIDGWTTGSSVRNGTAVALNANTRYDIVLETFNQTGGANCSLRWTPPGDATSTTVPSDYLFLPTAGNVVKDGAGSLQLTASNSYTGTTIVNAGTLEASADGALGFGKVMVQDGATLTLDGGTTQNYIADSADLVLSNSAVVNLNFSGTDTVRSLSVNGGATLKSAGVYGAPGSGAQFEDSHFAGTGRIRVLGTPSTTTLGSSGATTVYGATVTLTAVAHGSGATPTGTITFYDGANAMATVAVDGTGTAVLAVTDLLVATSPHSVKAVYNGDATYAPSTSSAVTQTVTAITLTGVTGSSKQYDQTTTAPLNLTNLIGVLPIDTNLVQLATNFTATYSDKNAGTNKSVSASGITLQGAAAGNYSIASTANAFGNISAKPLTVTNVTASAKVYDGTLSATVNASAAGITGSSTNVIYAGDDATLNTAAATGAFTNANVGTGQRVLFTVPMNGVDAGNYWATGSTTANITKGTSALGLASSANPANAGASVSFTATVTPLATGSVNFLTNGVLFSTVALSGSAANSGATTTLPAGATTVSAEYAGDSNVTGSTNSLQQTINNGVSQPTMTISSGTGSITITWSGTFNLQSVSALQSSGTGWQTIPGAVSGYTTTTTNNAQFYRLSN
jgi:autotransporter-associated beta strand protein